jgi:hypothetical protein
LGYRRFFHALKIFFKEIVGFPSSIYGDNGGSARLVKFGKVSSFGTPVENRGTIE